jgi:class 3 adenylate cyclase/tetratricopeptide (TPR) repeat protein
MDVAAWLERLGLDEYAAAFADNGVEGELLARLTNDDLKDLGVARLADRKRLLDAVAGLAAGRPDGGDAVRATPDERRQVTVLFADLAGYTRLVAEHGAEKIHGLLNRYFETVDSLVGEYGGRVDKHIGDNVMAIFGAPLAHGDDPERAVAVAQEIHERMPELARETGLPVAAHVGIACGVVVAGGTGSDAHREYTVTGDSVNLAARLQDRAAPGETLISDDVRRALAGKADLAPLGDLALKGIGEPVKAWRVVSPLRRGAAAAGPLIGRQAELRLFDGMLGACLATGKGHALVLRGEAGIGKSRLVEEFAAQAAARGYVTHKSLIFDFGVGKGQDAIRSAVRSLLGLEPGSGRQQREAAAERAITGGIAGANSRAFLYDLLDLPQPAGQMAIYDAMSNDARQAGKRAVVRELLASASAVAPVAMFVEDIHWANATVLRHLAEIAACATDARIILVMTSRQEGYPIDSAWRSETGGCALMTVDIGPLRAEEASALANIYLQDSQGVAKDCVARAGGNPLFLVQLLLNARDRAGSEIPATIQSLVLARMDRLLAAERLALQAASVLGQKFTLDALRFILANAAYECARLVAAGLVRSESGGYLFSHALVQQGAYDSLLEGKRRELHGRAAEYYGEREPALHAQHLDRASDPRAAAAYLQAAAGMAARFHFETALPLIARGIEIAPTPDTRHELLCLQGDALRGIGDTNGSIAAYTAALACADGDAARIRAMIGVAGGLRVLGRREEALANLAGAQRLAEATGSSEPLARIHYLRGNVLFPSGDIDGCLREHEAALRFARLAGSHELEARAFGGLGDAHYLRGHMRSACEQFRACVAMSESRNLRSIAVANRHMIGWTRMYLLEFREAIADGEAAAEMARQISDNRVAVLANLLLATAKFEIGEVADAARHSVEGSKLAEIIGTGNFRVQCIVWQARAESLAGRMKDAMRLVDDAVDLTGKVGETFFGPSALAFRAALGGDSAGRRRDLERGRKILDRGCVAHNHFWYAQFAIDGALAHGEWQEAERFAADLEHYCSTQPLPWAEFLIERGRVLALVGQGRRDTALDARIGRLREIADRAGLAALGAGLEGAVR